MGLMWGVREWVSMEKSLEKLKLNHTLYSYRFVLCEQTFWVISFYQTPMLFIFQHLHSYHNSYLQLVSYCCKKYCLFLYCLCLLCVSLDTVINTRQTHYLLSTHRMVALPDVCLLHPLYHFQFCFHMKPPLLLLNFYEFTNLQ